MRDSDSECLERPRPTTNERIPSPSVRPEQSYVNLPFITPAVPALPMHTGYNVRLMIGAIRVEVKSIQINENDESPILR
jgi:hypothetical protein